MVDGIWINECAASFFAHGLNVMSACFTPHQCTIDKKSILGKPVENQIKNMIEKKKSFYKQIHGVIIHGN